MSSSLPESRTELTIVFEALRFVESLVVRAEDDKKVGKETVTVVEVIELTMSESL